MDERGLWGIDEVARYLAIPRSSVYKMTSEKGRERIPYLKLGGRLRFRKADIDRWLDALLVSPVERLEYAKRRAAGR
jgi:excisionase family DNA binding protein